jgi:hypothetical protein
MSKDPKILLQYILESIEALREYLTGYPRRCRSIGIGAKNRGKSVEEEKGKSYLLSGN